MQQMEQIQSKNMPSCDVKVCDKGSVEPSYENECSHEASYEPGDYFGVALLLGHQNRV